MDNQKLLKAPILICGMHRSGTSLFAQILNSCGLYLGPESQMMQAHSDDNPSGYWEYLSEVRFADSLLSRIESSWVNLNKVFSNTWLKELNIEEEKQNAVELFKPLMDSGEIWGWKDPRASILLPFWKTVFPNLKVVICLRNPLEVSFSLSKRYLSSHVDFEDSLVLWRDYHKILIDNIQDMDHIVTHYEAIFYDPEKELKRLCDFSGLSPTKKSTENAKDKIKYDLYRGVATEKLLVNFDKLPKGLLLLYRKFSEKAGPVYKSMLVDQQYEQYHSNQAFKTLFSTSYKNFDKYYHKFSSDERELLQKDQLIKNLNAQLIEQEQEILYYALSKSWRFTRPFRKIAKFFKRRGNG